MDRETQYPGFHVIPSYGYQYDLKLLKDGMTANIIGKKIVSYDGPNDKVNGVEEALKQFGFNV